MIFRRDPRWSNKGVSRTPYFDPMLSFGILNVHPDTSDAAWQAAITSETSAIYLTVDSDPARVGEFVEFARRATIFMYDRGLGRPNPVIAGFVGGRLGDVADRLGDAGVAVTRKPFERYARKGAERAARHLPIVAAAGPVAGAQF